MNKYIFIVILMFVHASQGWTQTVSRNNLGEMIVVFDDGSWRYYESSDSTLLKEDANHNQKQKIQKPRMVIIKNPEKRINPFQNLIFYQ
jgi:hypothetical protein